MLNPHYLVLCQLTNLLQHTLELRTSQWCKSSHTERTSGQFAELWLHDRVSVLCILSHLPWANLRRYWSCEHMFTLAHPLTCWRDTHHGHLHLYWYPTEIDVYSASFLMWSLMFLCVFTAFPLQVVSAFQACRSLQSAPPTRTNELTWGSIQAQLACSK